MRALEVVHLRMAVDGVADLVDVIRESVGAQWESMEIRIYRHARLGSDVIVHLHREIADEHAPVSDVGTRLAALLREHGMVEHSVWVEARGRADG